VQLPRQFVGTEVCIEFMYLKYTVGVSRIAFGLMPQPSLFLLLWSAIAVTAPKAIALTIRMARRRVFAIPIHLADLS
jgi:hypothetical protein